MILNFAFDNLFELIINLKSTLVITFPIKNTSFIYINFPFINFVKYILSDYFTNMYFIATFLPKLGRNKFL